MFNKFHWCLLLLTQEECRNRQRLTFEIGGSFCSSVTHLHYRLFTRHCFLKIPSAPWNERNAIPKAEINTWELVEHKYLLCVASKGRTDECQWQRKFICQRNEQVAIWNSEYESSVWLTFVGRIVWCVLPLSKFRQWIIDQKGEKVRCRSGEHLSTPYAFDFCSRLSCIASGHTTAEILTSTTSVGPTHLFSYRHRNI